MSHTYTRLLYHIVFRPTQGLRPGLSSSALRAKTGRTIEPRGTKNEAQESLARLLGFCVSHRQDPR